MKIHFIPQHALAVFVDRDLKAVISPPTGALAKDRDGTWDDEGLVKTIIEGCMDSEFKGDIPEVISLSSEYTFTLLSKDTDEEDTFEIELKPVLIY